MSSEPADGVRPVHAVRSEWILSGARGKVFPRRLFMRGFSEYPSRVSRVTGRRYHPSADGRDRIERDGRKER